MPNNIAIAFLTKDKVELSKRTIEPLLKAPVDVFFIDGSTTDAGKDFPNRYRTNYRYWNVKGGPDAAVVFALTTMLEHPNDYRYVGLCENDVLLAPDWFDQTFSLFDRPVLGTDAVGSVSARAYVDRVLFQCDGYAVMHNLGWGQQILTRQAATLALHHMRTSYTLENLAKWWAFTNNENWLCADWGNEKILASHGFASLALTPSPVQMIGQDPPLVYQNLQLVETPIEFLRNDKQFDRFCVYLGMARREELSLNEPMHGEFRDQGNGAWIYFAHQLPSLGCKYAGNWSLRFQQGFGPFAWQSGEPPSSLIIPVIGSCEFLVAGGEKGGEVFVKDLASGYETRTTIAPESKLPTPTPVKMPAHISYRELSLDILSPGLALYAIRVREPQPWFNGKPFTHATLPPVEKTS